jgi:predicted DNA-binding protein
MLGAHTREGTVKRVTVVMPPDMHKLLKYRSIQTDKTMNDQILEAVKTYLSKYGSEKNSRE